MESCSSDKRYQCWRKIANFEFRRLIKEREDAAFSVDTNECKSECIIADNACDITMDDRTAFERIKLRARTTLFYKHDVKVASADSEKIVACFT